MAGFTGKQIAGALFVVVAVLRWLAAGEYAFVQFTLGLLLLLVTETTKADLLRLVVFVWVGIGVLTVALEAFATSAWSLMFPSLMFGIGIVGLMLERLSARETAICGGLAGAGVLIGFLL